MIFDEFRQKLEDAFPVPADFQVPSIGTESAGLFFQINAEWVAAATVSDIESLINHIKPLVTPKTFIEGVWDQPYPLPSARPNCCVNFEKQYCCFLADFTRREPFEPAREGESDHPAFAEHICLKPKSDQ